MLQDHLHYSQPLTFPKEMTTMVSVHSKHHGIRASAGDRAVSTVAHIITGLFALMCFVPFLLVVIYSFTPYDLYLKNHFDFFPERLTLDAYRMVLNYRYIWTGYQNTLFITLVGTLLSMVLLVLTAYPLTKNKLKGRNLMMSLWIITMFFSGGMIPDYMLMRSLKLTNSLWSLILSSLLGCYNLVLMKNYIKGLPGSLEEAALIDGANEVQILFRIILPLCLPILATLGLFTAVGYWNSYFSAIIYITKRPMWPLQLVMRELLFESGVNEMTALDERVSTPFLLKMASIVVASVPIMCVYPFLQRFFMTGLVLGGVKE